MRAGFKLISFGVFSLTVACGGDKGDGQRGSGGVAAFGGFGGTAGMGGVAGSGGLGGAGGSLGGSGGIDPGLPPKVTKGAEDRYLLRGLILAASGPLVGEVLVEGSVITCVAASCSSETGASGATLVETNGIVLPGLLDSHNHGLFNIFDESDWNPGKFFKNHTQWNSSSEPRYGAVVDAKQYLESVSKGANVSCELAKYAETKAIVAGTTSVLMAPGAAQRKCYGSVARTIDTTHNDLPDDKIQASISVPTESGAQKICNNVSAGITNAYVVHTAEGIDTTARKEYTTLVSRAGGCLKAPTTTVVHGTALEPSDFAEMAAAGMALIWSPKSNMFLYNDTTKIPAAISAGVKTIALAPDWALGGSVNLLDELAFAENLDNTKFSNVLSPERLYKMVTIDAAKALGVDQYLGTIEVGKRADLTVIGGDADKPYESLLQTRPATVRLVMVDGRVLYGDKVIEAAGPTKPGCEPLTVCGAEKFLCIAENDTSDKLDQTLSEIRAVLENELTKYDSTQNPVGGPLSPLAPLFKCP